MIVSEPWLSAAVVLSVSIAAGAQVLSGMGFALLAGPPLILALGQTDGVRVSVAMSLVLNVVLLASSYRAARWGDALRLALPAALLILPTLLLTARVSATGLTVAAGAAVLVGVGFVASGRRAKWVDRPAGVVAAGASSGVLNVIAGMSGPPIALLVTHRGWSPRVSTATLQAFALPLNIATLAVLGLPATQSVQILWGCLGLVLGTAAVWPLVAPVRARLPSAPSSCF